mgnify:CR=1 FL=1
MPRFGDEADDSVRVLRGHGEAAVDVDDARRLALRRELEDRIQPVLRTQGLDDPRIVARHAHDPPVAGFGCQRLGGGDRGVGPVELRGADVDDPGRLGRARADLELPGEVLAVEIHR